MISKTDKIVAHDLRDLITRLYKRLHKEISNTEQMSVAEQNVLYQLTLKAHLLPSELCAQLNISSQYMSQVLNRLEDLKFIARKSSPSDKRKTQVTLTKSGRIKISDSRKEREQWLADMLSKNYSTEDKAAIKKVITLLNILTEQ
ncbi:DNA-binding MarR family transcriptional regulator [Chitinophaga niastensis]|uniref:DNA-binding MarR family transcriptional regulator n=1 Tax=Chitinophaga niastensis TaxID=536980 RepID=A0A2P8HCH8_CHINA|nr:MarR family transcriptional regulator [Chitinophaga niastensis]PSL43929.1 DNA-binding MarR family transcriptional regulator [Chitinophaga niastensis]